MVRSFQKCTGTAFLANLGTGVNCLCISRLPLRQTGGHRCHRGGGGCTLGGNANLSLLRGGATSDPMHRFTAHSARVKNMALQGYAMAQLFQKSGLLFSRDDQVMKLKWVGRWWTRLTVWGWSWVFRLWGLANGIKPGWEFASTFKVKLPIVLGFAMPFLLFLSFHSISGERLKGTRHFVFGYCELLTQVAILLRDNWLTFFLQSCLWQVFLQPTSLKCPVCHPHIITKVRVTKTK